ncbi:MAG TPA: tetratricopeptide repeat protein, partial [Spirochaetes bacterium]|nr:tetratricopeptide repeat protein [Spirochaetota bacterium]
MKYLLIILGVIILFVLIYYLFEWIKSRLVQEGQNLEKHGQLKEAVDHYEKALSTKTDDEVLWILANLHEKMGKLNLAIFRLKEILMRRKYAPGVDEYRVLMKLGILLYKTNKDEQSFESFLKLYRKYPKDLIVLQYLIVLTLGQRRCDLASTLLKEFLKLDNEEPNSFFLLGICFYEHMEYLQAKKMFQEASKLSDENDWRYIFLESVCNYYTANYTAALDGFTKVSRMQSQYLQFSESLYQLMAQCHFELKNYEKAVTVLEKSISILSKIDPNFNDNNIQEDIFALSIYNQDLRKVETIVYTMMKKDPESYRWNALNEKLKVIIDEESEAIDEKDQAEGVETEGHQEAEDGMDTKEDREINIISVFKDFLDSWKDKDILGDSVWKLSNLSREGQFDLNKYFRNEMMSQFEAKPSGPTVHSIESFLALDRKDFLDVSRRILKNLNLEVVKEAYSAEEVFLSQGDGVDYIARRREGKKLNKCVVQIRRWTSNSIGELVLKELFAQIEDEKAKEGFFITTGALSQEALNYVEAQKQIY